MPFDLTNFGLAETLRCGIDIRNAMASEKTLESAARRLCEYLRRELLAADGSPACALARCYKTHPFADLEEGLQDFARASLPPGTAPRPSMKCLTLLGTVGEVPEWNSRRLSKGHQVIPLPSPEIVSRAPMIAQLIKEFGLDLTRIVEPGKEVVRDLMGKTYGIFFVPEARGSRFIPAQEDFVIPYGIRSVLGFGGSLPTGDLFAIVLFSRVSIPEKSAERFRTLALDVKSGFFRFKEHNTFDS